MTSTIDSLTDLNYTVAQKHLLTSALDPDYMECHPFPVLEQFGRAYGEVHGYVALILCPLGVLSNIFNVIVLNQPCMISPINFLLTALAICDGLLMTSYVPFAAYFLCGKHMTSASYGWAVFMLVHINLQNLLHSASGNIVVVLASFRVLYVRYLIKCQELCSMRRAQLALLLAVTLSTLLTIPCAVSHHIIEQTDSDEVSFGLDKAYMVTYIDNPTLIGYLYWNTAIFVKLLPLICLTILSLIIIITIRKRNAKMRRLKQPRVYSSLTSQSSKNEAPMNGTNQRGSSVIESESKNRELLKVNSLDMSATGNIERTPSFMSSRQSNNQLERDKSETRMTRLLLTVVFIFMIALLPQAILLFLNGFLGRCFTEHVYNALGDFTDLLTIMNNGINFVLYCAMSQQFRIAFLQLFCPWSGRVKRQQSVGLSRPSQRISRHSVNYRS